MMIRLASDQSLLIPRADAAIARTVARMRTVMFMQDPLMTPKESFIWSIWSSATKREGTILEMAVMDAIDQTTQLRLMPQQTGHRKGKRMVDVRFEVLANHHIVALEIKRGSQHDSGSIRGFISDLAKIPELLQREFPQHSPGQLHFHIVFISGVPRIREGFTVADLKKTYGLDAALHIDTARRRFSEAVRAVIEERTK